MAVLRERTVSRAGWWLLTGELMRRRRALIYLAFWSTIESLPALVSGLLVAAALDQGFIVHRPLVGLGWLGLLGVTMVIRSLATRQTYPWLADIVEPLRDTLVRAVVEGALTQAVFGIDRADGAAVSRLSGQAETVRNLVVAMLRTLRSTVASLTLALVGLFALAPIIAGVTLPLLLLSLALFALSIRPLAARTRATLLTEENMARVSTQVLTGLRDVVACGAEDVASEHVGIAVTAEAKAVVSLARLASIRTLVTALGGSLPVFLVVLLAPWLLRSGRLTPGELVGSVTYLIGTLTPALHSMIGTVGGQGGQLSVRLHRLIETSPAPTMGEHRGWAEPPTHDLRINGLTFAYGPHAAPVIDGLIFDIPAGHHLAIVGPSGSGKSTLASLIAGLMDPQDGAVLLGGVPLRQVAQHHLRQTVALIPQEAYVFTGTLRENFAYLRPQVTTTDLDQAVSALGAHHLVQRLGGYDARLGVGGATLSAGEAQLIALVRVYISAARVTLLDEASCHLDPLAEEIVEEAFAATGRTLIIVAHRISSALRAKQVLLLDGTTACLGSHQELLRTSDLYADLVGYWKDASSRTALKRLPDARM